MSRIPILASAVICLSALQTLAQSSTATQDYNAAVTNGEITSGGADQGPGGLSARDVSGKRLLDAEGNTIGMIERVSKDGQTATVRGPGGTQISEPMSQLSLGLGAHTVIKQSGDSRADQLNAAENAQPVTPLPQTEQSGSSGSSTVTTTYTPTPTVTTTTNSTYTVRNR